MRVRRISRGNEAPQVLLTPITSVGLKLQYGLLHMGHDPGYRYSSEIAAPYLNRNSAVIPIHGCPSIGLIEELPLPMSSPSFAIYTMIGS